VEEEPGQPLVEFFQCPGAADGVAGVFQVGKDQAVLLRAPEPFDEGEAFGAGGRGMGTGDAAVGEGVVDAADGFDGQPFFGEGVEDGARGDEGEPEGVVGRFPVAVERLGDDVGDAPGIAVTAGDAGNLDEPGEGEGRLMGGDVEDALGVEGEDRVAGSLMFLSQFGGQRGMDGGVEEELDAAFPGDGADEFLREVFKGGEGAAEDDPGQFP
jgi:hypothetical protein